MQYPEFFGEICLLVPTGGEALGTVSTDTIVETVSTNNTQITSCNEKGFHDAHAAGTYGNFELPAG